MSNPVASATATSRSPPFPLFTHGIIVTFGCFLDDRSMAASAQVCKVWSKNLIGHLEDEYCRRIGYRSEIIKALRSRKLSLWRLPVLDLGGRMGSTDYIDFLQDKDMTSPLMRFMDARKRVGLAVRCRGNADGNVDFGKDKNRKEYRIRDLSSVVAVFRRHTSGNSWVYGGYWEFGVISRISRVVHKPNHQLGCEADLCPNCPLANRGQGRIIQWTSNLIKGIDPAIKLDGEIRQTPTPLSATPPQPVARPQPQPQNRVDPPAPPLSTLRKVCNAVSSFFWAIGAGFAAFAFWLGSLCRGR